MANNRTATYVSTLVYADEPQLLHLRAGKTHVAALAIPSPHHEARFIAATVTAKNWNAYLDQEVDLRFLFVYADVRRVYSFDLMKLKNGKVLMTPWEGALTENVLPSPRFFARNHTEDDEQSDTPEAATETLYVDGQWDIPDFGSFYSRYSDVYYFLTSTATYEDEDAPQNLKNSIADAFGSKAFRGGFSYVHLYDDLAANRRRTEKVSIDKIKYESPGYVNINGSAEGFRETRNAIEIFLADRKSIRELYWKIYSHLSKRKMLTIEGSNFDSSNPSYQFLLTSTDKLAKDMGLINVSLIKTLVRNNPLIFAKVVMSFYRRVEQAAAFFAQGRMQFSQVTAAASTSPIDTTPERLTQPPSP